jgi:hypothetical protein
MSLISIQCWKLHCQAFLLLVKSAGDIDAGVVDAQVLELEVPGVYSLRTKLPVPIDEDKMACRFDKKKKCLTVKLPALDADQ